jgi:hypothetical protein
MESLLLPPFLSTLCWKKINLNFAGFVMSRCAASLPPARHTAEVQMVPHWSTNAPMETPPNDRTVGPAATLKDPVDVTPLPQKDPVEVTPPPRKDPVVVPPPTLKDPIDVVPLLRKDAVAPPTTKYPIVLVTPALKTPETGDDSALVLTRVTCRRVPTLYHSSELQYCRQVQCRWVI